MSQLTDAYSWNPKTRVYAWEKQIYIDLFCSHHLIGLLGKEKCQPLYQHLFLRFSQVGDCYHQPRRTLLFAPQPDSNSQYTEHAQWIVFFHIFCFFHVATGDIWLELAGQGMQVKSRAKIHVLLCHSMQMVMVAPKPAEFLLLASALFPTNHEIGLKLMRLFLIKIHFGFSGFFAFWFLNFWGLNGSTFLCNPES